MYSDNDREEIEQEINEQTFTDDEEQLDMYEQTKMKNGFGKSFIKKFKNLQIRYKKDKRKTLVALAAILAMLSVVCGSSYAYLTYVSKTNNSVTISLGSLTLIFQNEENAITLQNAVPVKDSVGLDSDKEYNFEVKNTGTIPANYTITLDNICALESGVDTCIPDEYIKVGIKIGNGSYKVVERSEKSKYIIETGSLDAGEVQSYKMKVWLAHRTPNTYNGADNKNVYYKGKLGLTYEQGKDEYNPEPGATVLYSDGTLIINEPTTKRQENITAHGAVSKEYSEMKSEGTDVEKYIFTSWDNQPWASDRTSITKVKIGQKLRPASTQYWFYGLTNMTTGDFTNLDTKNVTSMSHMFCNAGYNSSVTSFTLTGLDNWNTSKTTSMANMFANAGYNATTWSVGNLSNWDTSSVTDMYAMFFEPGRNATVWDIGDLSNWNTSNVTNMRSMFSYAGLRATTFNIGNLSNWDTSKVTDMASMFSYAGYYSTTWNSIGTLKVYATSIAGMFDNCKSAKVTVNLYNNPTSYQNAFGNSATASGALITVNYSSATTNIDNIVATKSSNSNVVKGSVIS